MSQFEFVQITFALILGLGVTTVLASIGQQFRLRHIAALSAVQLSSQVLLLFSLLIWLWGFWAVKDIEWSFSLFLFHALPPMFLALAAHVSAIDCGIDCDVAELQYFRNQRPFYGFWATASFVGLLHTVFYVYSGELELNLSIPLFIARALGVALLCTLMLSRSKKIHGIALLLLASVSSSILISYFFVL
ncbi:MAG: hypothetical protein DHS20C12_28540 [Pseudohongiella sp.]|nr:MAG: hypothetical protein DHS20C12_28540 [Pseudohongiella sp.]